MTPELKGFLFFAVIRLLVVFTVVLVSVAMLTLMERKLAGWFQNRPGPNRVGPWGLLQPAADGLKNILKEETRPAAAHHRLFMLAPAMSFVPALMLIAVIPLAAPLPVDVDWNLPLIGQIVYQGNMPMTITDVPIGILFVLAFSSMGVYGIAVAGWSSNSKYSLLGGLRASAQMVSYEVAMGLSLVPVLLLTGNVGFGEIIATQQQGLWLAGPLFVSFFLTLVAGFAETNRLPFDLPEAESELVAGYHSEYSAMKFSMFYIAEYAHIITISAMLATIYFGGWDIPFTDWDERGGVLQTLATHGAFFAKTFFWIFFVMWIRWTLPRFRYDQLMALGWKVMLPMALAYVMVIATVLWVINSAMPEASELTRALILTIINLVLAVLIFWVFDSGRIVRGVAAMPGQRTRAEA